MKRSILMFVAVLAVLFTPLPQTLADRRRAFSFKPPYGARINNTLPITKGLVIAYLFYPNNRGFANSGSSATPICYAPSVYNLAIDNHANWCADVQTSTYADIKMLTRNGGGFQELGASAPLSLIDSAQNKSNATGLGITGPMSLLVWVSWNTLSSHHSLIWDDFGSDAAAGLLAFDITTHVVASCWGGASNCGSTTASGATPVAANTICQAGFIRSGKSGSWTNQIVRNGRIDGSATGITIDPIVGNIGEYIGGDSTNGAMDATFYIFYMFNRAITPQEAASLYHDPYQMFEMPSNQLLGGGTLAAIRHRVQEQ